MYRREASVQSALDVTARKLLRQSEPPWPDLSSTFFWQRLWIEASQVFYLVTNPRIDLNFQCKCKPIRGAIPTESRLRVDKARAVVSWRAPTSKRLKSRAIREAPPLQQ